MLLFVLTAPTTSAFVAWSRITTKNDSHNQLLAPRVGVNQTFDNALSAIGLPLSAVFAHRHSHHDQRLTSPGPSTLITQRPHSSGCAAFTPKSARLCQQRTQL